MLRAQLAAADLQQIGRFPIPDTVLAEAIAKLQALQPRAIGLNLYRELPVPPGSEQLNALLAEADNLIGAAKVSGKPIPPPRVLAARDRVGFADQLLDSDGKVRRILLTVEAEETGELAESTRLRLALNYLAEEGIQPPPRDASETDIQLSRVLVQPLRPHHGGYTRVNTGGYQLLLNYLGEAEQFETFSLRQLLADAVPRRAIADRLVLIGLTAASGNTLFQTPYSNRLAGTVGWAIADWRWGLGLVLLGSLGAIAYFAV